jgi:3'(2'), 5'-bisphosphate nucleotidase
MGPALAFAGPAAYAAAMSDAELLAIAERLARAAGAAIMAVRAAGFTVRDKPDHSPVTAADTAAEALILAGLHDATPAIAAIAEEATAAGAQTVAGEQFWLVDPLDGTREFAAGSDDFTVNIGLVRGSRPVLGAVYVPASDEMFTGIVGPDRDSTGAWKQDRSGHRPIATRAMPAAGAVVLASRHHGADAHEAAWLAARPVAQVLRLGSAVKFLRLAEGAADLYPRFGRTMEWDTAAPQAVLEAAGGAVLRADGTRLDYRKPGWDNPAFFCFGQDPSR